ncbi:GTPase IMAP family member 7-like [Physella acuta]|uniref:GTPase IMAP family member 7-like n=1 Tax=Physella acuta TaxID=109671 RepID=UPI0027DC4662|nr:GTPase IMAP family member 7-like [Physella acuta]
MGSSVTKLFSKLEGIITGAFNSFGNQTYPLPRIDLLLIGKSGNGKSATGNTILDQERFVCKSTTSAETQAIEFGITEHGGYQIKVVDGLTVCDSRLDDERSVEQLNEAAKLALAANPEGYHAFLLVLKYGNRFTREEQDTVQIFKKLFGDDFVKNFCIIIITCGDLFNAEQSAKGTEGLTFHEWCNQQEGPFKDLFLECNRAILFDNTCTSEDEVDDHADDLLEKVNEILYDRRHKLSDRFQLTKDIAIPDPQQTQTTGEAKREASKSLDLQHTTQNSTETDDLMLRQAVQELSAKQDEILTALREQAQIINALQKKVSDESDLSRRFMEEIKQRRQQEEEVKTNFQQELKNQREEFEKQNEILRSDRTHLREFDFDVERKYEDVVKERKLQRAKGILEKVEKLRGRTRQFQNIRASQFRLDF